MFKKILIAEDFDTMNLGLVPILEQITSAQIDHVKYCDDAFLKIKRALFDKAPYDLLISDLSFEKDHRETKLSSGKELIEAVKKEQPDINVIVYSVENRPYTIKSLFEDSNINAYVSKGRDGSVQLSKAVTTVAQDEDARYISPELAHILTDKSILEIDEYDIQLIKHLSEGLGQEEIGFLFKKQDVTPSSTSSIEKRINKLKIFFKAKNSIHLVSIAKDMGLI